MKFIFQLTTVKVPQALLVIAQVKVGATHESSVSFANTSIQVFVVS
ncbi:MAG: hypothetical protein U9Q66_03840 [Patescibacteria group bacterium]|nr:hypothetical protein [Patescibacteria group bacterium]